MTIYRNANAFFAIPSAVRHARNEDTTFSPDDVPVVISKQHDQSTMFYKYQIPDRLLLFNAIFLNPSKSAIRGHCKCPTVSCQVSIMEQSERQPLLLSPSQNNDSQPLLLGDPRVEIPTEFPESLPGSSPGKTLSWTSAYILVVSRVIGSGIFATPGSIVKSTGSIGLTVLVWLFGTILAACGMSISMEYGCMLPRSGGDKVDTDFPPACRGEHPLRFHFPL